MILFRCVAELGLSENFGAAMEVIGIIIIIEQGVVM